MTKRMLPWVAGVNCELLPQPYPAHPRLVLAGGGLQEGLDVQVGQVQREDRIALAALGPQLGGKLALQGAHPVDDLPAHGHGP